MEVKKIVEGMTAPQVAQVIDDNFKAQNAILEEDIAKQNNVIGVSEYKDFSEAEAVNVGDVRKYNGSLYECVEATTGAFDASKWKKSSFKAETEKKLSELGSKVDKNKANIGFTLTGEYPTYQTFYEGVIPKGSKIENRGVHIIVFDKEKNNRLDVRSNDIKELVFDAYSIQTAELEGQVDVEIIGTKKSIESISSYLRKGCEVITKDGLSYNTGVNIAEGLNVGDKLQVRIVSATEDTGLYIQAFDSNGGLVRLKSLAKIGEVYNFIIEKKLNRVFVTNLSSSESAINIKIEVGYGLNVDIYTAINADIAANKADIAANRANINANKADINANKVNIAANKANIGYSIIGYNNSYDDFAKNILIPIGTEIVNKGVFAICFNKDKTLRLDLESGQRTVSTFEIAHVQGASVSGNFHMEVIGLSQVLDECVASTSRLGINKTINVIDETSAKNPIYEGFLPQGTKLKLKVTPQGENPDRITLYTIDNAYNDRLYDSAIDTFGEEKVITLRNDIERIKIYYDGFQPFVVDFVVFGDILINGDNIEEKSIREEHLSDELKSKINSAQKETIKFNSFKNKGLINGEEYLTLPSNHIGKNYILSGRFNNKFNSVSIGVGYSSYSTYKNRDYSACWVEIDSVNIKQYRYYNQDYVLIDTKAHGLNITDTMVISIEAEIDKSVLRMYNNLGDIYEQDIQLGCGTPFIHNSGTSSIDVELSFYPKELIAKIWAFGDSYFNFVTPERWPYYLAKNGNINWLSNNQPGLSPQDAYNDLISLLSLNYIPQYIVWCLGMNGSTSESTDSEGSYVINDYQKTYIDSVFNLCKSYGIELILATIPTVPARQKTGFNTYVKSLGVRFIDFAKAVGATSEGVWYDGLLSSDKVHPSAKGAAVLASQVLIDAPELTTKVY